VAIAHDLAMAVFVLGVLMAIDPLRDFSFDSLGQQPLGAVPKNAAQNIVVAGGWQGNDPIATLSHGGVLRGEIGYKQTKFKPKYAAFFNSTHPQLSAIARPAWPLGTPGGKQPQVVAPQGQGKR
jgi:hypothetical protein